MINPLRHMTVFPPDQFGDRRVDIIGAGATGSRMAISLAKLGIKNIHVWDDDVVAEHNVPNQAFGVEHIGIKKVKALKQIILQSTGTRITTHTKKVRGPENLGEIVFLLTDTMESRQNIWEKCLKLKFGVKLVIETRMGTDQGRCYAINPCSPAEIKGWENTLYSDDEAEESACGANPSVGPTAEFISGLAVWQFIRWFSVQFGGQDKVDNEIIFGLRPTVFLTNQF